MMKKESSNNKLGRGAGKNSSTLPNYVVILLIIIIAIGIIALLPTKVLLAFDYKTEEYYKSWRIKDGDSFTIEYTHSVQLTPVTETYNIDGYNIILKETTFKSYGAGLPSTTPYKFEITSNGFRIYDINEKMDYLVYRTGAERANHKLIYENKNYDFLNFSKPRAGVRFKIIKTKFFSHILREGFN